MSELVQLTPEKHQDLKVKANAALAVAEAQHAISLRVSEISQAISSFPVFFTKVDQSGQWAISAMTSLEVQKNLFCTEDKWLATYMPNAMRTYPLFLMKSPEDESKPTVGILEDAPAFSRAEGQDLFDANGKPSLFQNSLRAQLDEDIGNSYHTMQFLSKLQEMNLMKAMDVQVFYADKQVNTLKGLHTIDEAKMQSLSPEEFEDLRKLGYLPPIYAMLMSIFQLNNLINHHNQQEAVNKVVQVKMEVPKV